MEIKVASKAGFCSGVKRALDLAMDTLKENKGPVSTLGPLVHNPQVVASLVEKGISVIDDVKDIQEGALVIRSHGVSPDVLVQARERGINIIDATCPNVRRAQELAGELTEQGYQVVVVGDRGHPEVQGIVGWTNGKAVVVENPEEAALLDSEAKLGIIAQTTQMQENLDASIAVSQEHGVGYKRCK